MNLKTCRENEIETERLDDKLVIRKKKEPKKRQKKVLLEGKLVHTIRFCATFCTPYPKKKCTCFPTGDVCDRRRERYNRVYVLSRVRTNRVSLYLMFMPDVQLEKGPDLGRVAGATQRGLYPGVDSWPGRMSHKTWPRSRPFFTRGFHHADLPIHFG